MMILVTGSAGHLGEALMRTLKARGQRAIGLDIKPSAYTDLVGSVTDRAIVRHALDGASAVLHTATLHKPHVVSHPHDAFVQINIAGTLALLEGAVAAGVGSFVFTSTTSVFGSMLSPPRGAPAAWVTEDVAPIPKNIYGVSKGAAETVCEMFARRRKLPVIVLRTSRFFPEMDDDPALHDAYGIDNLQANELLYRRIDLADVVEAHLSAMAKAPDLGFGRYIVSASSPFEERDLIELRADAPAVVRRLFPDFDALYRAAGWTMLPSIDRVYVNRRAIRDLDWRPAYGFQQALDALARGTAFRSPLALAVGTKGYHDEAFGTGPYPVS